MPPLSIREVRTLTEAADLWRMFSPNEYLWDDWTFRSLFHGTYDEPGEPIFIVGSIGGEDVALLALQHTEEDGCIEFFGGDYMEDNLIFFKPGCEAHVETMFRHATSLGVPLRLLAIRGTDPYTKDLPLLDHKYVYRLEGMKTVDDILAKHFSLKTQSTFRRKIKRLEADGLTVRDGTMPELDLLYEFNIQAFGNDSSFTWPRRQRVFRELLASSLETRLMTFMMADKIVAVSLGIKCGKTYVYLNSGTDRAIDNLGTYVVLQHIKEALRSGATLFDTELGGYTWKERWHLDPVPQYQFLHGSPTKPR